MTENVPTSPFIIEINEPVQTIQLSEELNNLGIHIEPTPQELTTINTLSNPQIVVESTDNPITIVQETHEPITQSFGIVRQEEQPCIVQIVYPQDLCLSPAQNVVKRGRPKKKKQEDLQNKERIVNTKAEDVIAPPKSARTRSGRLVKLPKHIEKDFKKIEISAEEQEIQVTDFKRFEEKENTKLEFPEIQMRKRVISAQYKCPKCLKAYLGKNRMIEHLKKYPDHGPLPEGFQEFNFDVWNYLFDITQKCKSGQRGIKFCEELSNLLHNVQLLKSALFKTVTDSKNCVHIDKVLGNAIGLPPGKYKFDENELYKDVTVLKLITNSDFFKPNSVNKQNHDNPTIKNKTIDDNHLEHYEIKKLKQDVQTSNQESASNDQAKFSKSTESESPALQKQEVTKENKQDENVYSFNSKSCQNEPNISTKSQPSVSESYPKKMEVDTHILPSDLLSENLLLQTLPNPRNSVDDLMLTSVDNSSNLLDNSTSSDEVMNVDQFVNERFKKIVGPDVELSQTSLNLDLPSLELFQFHTT